jgi:hypothetical protein
MLMHDLVSDGQYVTRYYKLPAFEGNMAVCLPELPLLPDCLWQITLGLKAMHKHGIIHQNLIPKNLYLARSTLFCSGFRVVIGGFNKSGSVVLHQSPLNPLRPTPECDIKAFYQLGVHWNIPDWPKYNNLVLYEAWCWLQPVASCLKPSELLLMTLRVYEHKFPSARRMLYVLRSINAGFRELETEQLDTVTSTDADLLAMAVDLQDKAEHYSTGAARLCHRCILELLDYVLWETPEANLITEMRDAIATKLTLKT